MIQISVWSIFDKEFSLKLEGVCICYGQPSVGIVKETYCNFGESLYYTNTILMYMFCSRKIAPVKLF